MSMLLLPAIIAAMPPLCHFDTPLDIDVVCYATFAFMLLLPPCFCCC